MFESIQGHKRQLVFLEKAIAMGRLAHAYTFAGPDGVGKKLIARELARELLKSEGTNESSFQPDLIEIDGSAEIKIETIRDLIYKLSLKPYQAKYKIAIIDNAENLNLASANALLKSLEEPKPYTIIILITTNPNKLPKTIISRTQKINFARVSEVVDEEEPFYEIFSKGMLTDKLIAAYEIAVLETVEIKAMLDSWLMKLEKELLIQASKNLAKKIYQVSEARKFLDANVNAKLLLTNLMIRT